MRILDKKYEKNVNKFSLYKSAFPRLIFVPFPISTHLIDRPCNLFPTEVKRK
jgi:hypothetical protein